jgi:hypothetical protein
VFVQEAEKQRLLAERASQAEVGCWRVCCVVPVFAQKALGCSTHSKLLACLLADCFDTVQGDAGVAFMQQ